MIFDRRKKLPVSPQDLRAEYRQTLTSDHPLRMLILRGDGSQFETTLIDLTARGAGFETPSAFELHEDEAIEVVVTNEADRWAVRTPAMARHHVDLGGTSVWGVEFINLGNLYGQWDNILGEHFNRRTDPRVAPELDRPTPVTLTLDEHPISATLHDMSPTGMCMAVRHTEVSGLERDTSVHIAFKLPRSRRNLQGTAIVRRNCRAGALDLLGVEFDMTAADGFAKHERTIAAYCKKRAKALSKWEASWNREAA
ncbi:MAG: c-di-GMP-binding flagellar brake protein YcgR [Chlamydiales bacterium]